MQNYVKVKNEVELTATFSEKSFFPDQKTRDF